VRGEGVAGVALCLIIFLVGWELEGRDGNPQAPFLILGVMVRTWMAEHRGKIAKSN
jgi:hypothetical protein